MPLRRFAWLLLLLLVGACGEESSPILVSAQAEGDMLYATYRHMCGPARLTWSGAVNPAKHEVLLELSYTDEGESDCTREVVLDLTPIRDAFPDVRYLEGEIRLLVPAALDDMSLTPVDYMPAFVRECSEFSARGVFPESTAADGFAKVEGVELESCGREWATQGSSCCERRTVGYDCLLRALETCTPTRFGEGYGTSAGDPILTDYFVMPTKHGCELVVITDFSRDRWKADGAEVQTMYCASASLAIKASGQCPDLLVDDCGL